MSSTPSLFRSTRPTACVLKMLLVQAELRRRVLEGAVALVAEEAVRPAQAADDEVEVAVVVEVAPGGAGRAAGELRQARPSRSRR